MIVDSKLVAPRSKVPAPERGTDARVRGALLAASFAAFAAPGIALGSTAPGRAPHERRAPAGTWPDVSTYAAIDAALEGELLIPPGATWRYFPGTEEPSPELEWTRPDFDDSAWSEGPSPIGFGHDDNATRLDDLERV